MTAPIPEDLEEIAKKERLLGAYLELFGQDEKSRDPNQLLVWQDLEIRGYEWQTTAIPKADGRVDPLSMGHAEGARALFLYIKTNVKVASELARQSTK
jgi:hypothetical protein